MPVKKGILSLSLPSALCLCLSFSPLARSLFLPPSLCVSLSLFSFPNVYLELPPFLWEPSSSLRRWIVPVIPAPA